MTCVFFFWLLEEVVIFFESVATFRVFGFLINNLVCCFNSRGTRKGQRLFPNCFNNLPQSSATSAPIWTPRKRSAYGFDELSRETNLIWRRTLCEYKTTMWSALVKNGLPKQKRNARVFERAKHKTTSYAPYKREKIVSSTIITFCPVNLDTTNLRKQTSVHLLWGQTTLIVDKKGSTKIDFNKFARRLLGKKQRFL